MVNKKIKNNDEDEKNCEWFEIKDEGQVIRLNPDTFFNLLQDCFSYEDIPEIMSSISHQYRKATDQFIKIFILHKYSEVNLSKLKQELSNWTAGIFY